jgi:hypothetical protein
MKPGPEPREPDRTVVRRIVAEEAAAAGVTEHDVLCDTRKHKAVLARYRAVARIAHETGCSARGLAKVWGMSEGAAKKWMNAGEPSRYDAPTRRRLVWAYGADRAREIITGRDPTTQADIAAWRQLGGQA